MASSIVSSSTRSAALANGNAQQALVQPVQYNTVVFSRKTTYNPPSSNSNDSSSTASIEEDDEQVVAANPLASLVHQSDRNGKAQTRALPVPTHIQAGAPQSPNNNGLNRFLNNMYSAFGLSQEQQLLQKQAQQTASPVTVLQSQKGLIPNQLPQDTGRKCLVLDLDETLVHSSFKPTVNPDYIIPVEIDGHTHRVYVCKRPGVDEFLDAMGKIYEIVVYTASLSKYADPLLDQLDRNKNIRYRLFREHCVHHEGTYVKDLSLLDRAITQTIIIDNSPLAYMFHPENAIGCSSFIDDMRDIELHTIKDFLIQTAGVTDVRQHMHMWNNVSTITN